MNSKLSSYHYSKFFAAEASVSQTKEKELLFFYFILAIPFDIKFDLKIRNEINKKKKKCKHFLFQTSSAHQERTRKNRKKRKNNDEYFNFVSFFLRVCCALTYSEP